MAYVALSIEIPFTVVRTGKVSIVFIFSYYAMLMFLFCIFVDGLFGAGHLMQSIFYKVKGYGFSPILLYPIVIGADPKRPIQLFGNFYYLADVFFPKKMIAEAGNEYHSEKLSAICNHAQISSLVLQMVVIIAAALMSFVSRRYFLGISFLLIGCGFLVLACTDTSSFQGIWTRKKYIEQGYLAVYMAKQVILYDDSDSGIYDEFENRVILGIPENLRLTCVAAVKHVYMLKSITPGFKYPRKINQYVEERFLPQHLDEYSDIELGDEKFSLLKSCLCYALLNDDENMREQVIKRLFALRREEMRSFIRFDTAEWYLNVIQNYEIQKNGNFLTQNKLLRPNQLYHCFPNYRRIEEMIIERVEGMCSIKG